MGFALLHVGDTKNLIDPADMPGRLAAAGFEHVSVVRGPRQLPLPRAPIPVAQ